MTLMDSILRHAHSTHSMRSPPPEPQVLKVIEKEKKRIKKKYKYSIIQPKVDATPPAYEAHQLIVKLRDWNAKKESLQRENINLVMAIRKTQFSRGRVDSRWRDLPQQTRKYFDSRVTFLKRVRADNKNIYGRIVNQSPRVTTTEVHRQNWSRIRNEIISRAQCKFVLFPPIPEDIIEDPAFIKPPGVKRPRVFLTLQMDGCAAIGELQAELFVDICPLTCQLFVELLLGRASANGYSYVGTHFFRKVPHLFWSGGDVVLDNGFGCFMQSGRRCPIGAENYHFSHSMPGLLSMRVTCDDEMCGIFNIMFKPLRQFDLKNVVFGRIIRPSAIYDSISQIGIPLSPHPLITLSASRYKQNGVWVTGTTNTRLAKDTSSRI